MPDARCWILDGLAFLAVKGHFLGILNFFEKK